MKFDKYKPRSEPPSGLAGGKVVKVDRVEWRAIADQQTAVNALIAGEIDFIEQPSHDLLPVAAQGRATSSSSTEPARQPVRVPLQHRPRKPFDNPKIRQARAATRFNQEDFLQAVIGDTKYYKICKAMFVCGTPLASDEGHGGPARVELREVAGAAEGSAATTARRSCCCTRPTCRC